MPYTAQDLVRLLDLEAIEHNIYRGQNRDIGTGRIFGGQVLAQSLVAARRTIEPAPGADARECHSLHGYFILAGDLTAPVVYFVDRLRDGGSFTTRRVTGIQHGQAIFNMSASFHKQEDGPAHQTEMPDVPPPEELRSELDMLRERADRIPSALRGVLTQDRPLDYRPVDPVDPFHPERRGPGRCIWIRSNGELGDAPLDHQAALAYASDYGLLGAALQPHAITYRDPEVMLASLDHAIWFHRPFRVDDWLLYVIESPTSGGARAYSRGSIFTRDGELVASVAQEGLLRMRRGKTPSSGEGAAG